MASLPTPAPVDASAATTSEAPAIAAPLGDAPIEIDDFRSEAGDSSYEDVLSAFTASLTSSVVDYPMEHGRRYHAYRSGAYPLPNDEPELERLDLTHALMTKGVGSLFTAPLEKDKVHRILDLGTGTGLWAIEIRNDLSPIQSPWVPPNVKFEVDDIESQWSHSQKFDFIFCRYLAACIADWPKLAASIFDALSPGGWAEFQDYDLQYYSEDGSLTDDHDTLKWINTLLEAAHKTGREPSPGPRLEGLARDAGFQNIVHKRLKFPIGPWAKDPKMKEIGLYNLTQVLDGLEGFSLRLFCDVLGWQKEEVLILVAKVRKELKTPGLHAQFDFHVVYGQKP